MRHCPGGQCPPQGKYTEICKKAGDAAEPHHRRFFIHAASAGFLHQFFVLEPKQHTEQNLRADHHEREDNR